MLPINESLCKYLFDSEAEKIFTGASFSCKKNDKKKLEFVENSFEILMKVNTYFLSEKKAFSLVDPMAYNNQCHLYALKVARIQKKYSEKNETEKMSRNEENKFLHLCLLLSYSTTSDRKILYLVVDKAMKALNITILPKLRKIFKAFLLDSERCREKAARVALNRLFKTDLQQSLQDDIYSPLYKELYTLTHENLETISSRGSKEGLLYTLPKLAGIAFFVDQIAKEKIPFIVKVKILTENGSGGVLVHPSRHIKDDEPVIVLEAFATDGSPFIPESNIPFTVPNCREYAKRCPTYFHTYTQAKFKHAEKEHCFYCKETDINPQQYEKRIIKAIESPEKLFYALGVDFILKQQPQFLHFFENKEKYPLLCDLFQNTKPFIEEFGLDMNRPSAFSICHVYSDEGKSGKSKNFQLDMTREVFLKNLGLL